MDHPSDSVIEGLTIGTLTTAQSPEVQRRIYRCPNCLNRLNTAEKTLAIEDKYEPPHALKLT